MTVQIHDMLPIRVYVGKSWRKSKNFLSSMLRILLMMEIKACSLWGDLQKGKWNSLFSWMMLWVQEVRLAGEGAFRDTDQTKKRRLDKWKEFKVKIKYAARITMRTIEAISRGETISTYPHRVVTWHAWPFSHLGMRGHA